jgi:hypothetical protein
MVRARPMTYDEISVLREAQSIIYSTKCQDPIYNFTMDALDLIIRAEKLENDKDDLLTKGGFEAVMEKL